MEERESLREAENLRFRFQMNNRLRLESLAAVSKVFREFGEPISDDLLSSLVFAVPNELIASNGLGFVVGTENIHAEQSVTQADRPNRGQTSRPSLRSRDQTNRPSRRSRDQTNRPSRRSRDQSRPPEPPKPGPSGPPQPPKP